MKNRKFGWKTLLKLIGWFIGIWTVLLVALQVTLSEKVLTKVVNKYAAEYIDGELSFGSASVSMFKRFPRIFLTLEDFHVTYSPQMFKDTRKLGAQGHLKHAGCGEKADTLASFDRFSASINILSLMGGNLRIPHLRVVHPRIFLHSFANGESNLDILKFSSDQTDTVSSSIPLPKQISLGRISLSRHPHIVYTDSKDTVFAMIDVARIGFTGQIRSNSRVQRSRQPNFTPRNIAKGLTVDSLILAGRIKKDTMACIINKFYIQEDGDLMNIDAKAKTMMATKAFGRIHLPVDITGTIDFPKDTVPTIRINGLRAKVGDFPILANAEVRFLNDRAEILTQAGLVDCMLNDVFHGIAKNIIPELNNIETDAKLTLMAQCEGDYVYKTQTWPKLTAYLDLPEANFKHSELDSLNLKLEVAAHADTDMNGRLNLTVGNSFVRSEGLDIDIKGEAYDILGSDPSISIDGNLYASLDSLVRVLPDSLDITASGEISGKVQGNALLSQLSIYNFSRSNLRGNLKSDKIIVQMPSDSLNVDIKGMEVIIAPEELVSRRDSTKTFRLAGVTAKVKHGKINSGNSFSAQTLDLLVSAKNSVNTEVASDTSSRINPLSGRMNATMLLVKDSEGVAISLSDTKNSFLLRPKKDHPEIPVMSIRSGNERLTVSQGQSRAILRNANFKASAEKNAQKPKPRKMDSLQFQAFIQKAQMNEPEWMKEEDFRKQDIDIRLDETMAKYFREWKLDGELSVSNGNVITPYFPLRTSLKGFKLDFNNNEILLDTLKFVSGKSEIEAKGKLTGLRRAMLGKSNRGRLKLDLDIFSGKMNAGELMAAYQKGLNYSPSTTSTDHLSDSQLMEVVAVTDSVSMTDSTLSTLIVIPANLEANINLNAKDARYTGLLADTISARILTKERCLQITDARAQTNMGEITFEAFYSTRTKQDLKTGFDLNFKDITAEKAISLMPSIDTLVPMLKSFSGNLNCEVTATASLDTNMNIIMPSVNGILRVSGNKLTISENDMYTSLARKFMFKDKKEGHIENMKLEAVIQDNTLEIFPFVVSMDRYLIAMSGIQNLDMSYRYHASVIKSPLPVKMGIDVYGQDFDNMKFKIGKAKYKSSEIPVFSTVIDQTQINLRKAIKGIFDKGIDAAMNESIRQSAILDHKQKIGYVNAVDIQIEELSAQEQKQVEEAEKSENTENN